MILLLLYEISVNYIKPLAGISPLMSVYEGIHVHKDVPPTPRYKDSRFSLQQSATVVSQKTMYSAVITASPFEASIELLMLFEKNKCSDGMRSKSDEAWNPTSERPSYAFLAVYSLQQDRNPLL